MELSRLGAARSLVAAYGRIPHAGLATLYGMVAKSGVLNAGHLLIMRFVWRECEEKQKRWHGES